MIEIRIANVFSNLMYEELLGDGQNHCEQAVNHQNDGNGHAARVGQQLTTTTHCPEQLHILFVPPNNQNCLPSNTVASTTAVRNDNQTISILSNQLLKIDNKQNFDEELYAQNMRKECPAISGVEEKSRMEIVVDESLITSNLSIVNRKLSTVAGGIAEGSTSTNANDSQRAAPLGRMPNSNKQYSRFETIDLTSDQEDLADTSDSDQNYNGQTLSYHRQQILCEATGNATNQRSIQVFSRSCRLRRK